MAKFKIGDTFKYNGDVYKVVGLDSWGYNVTAIEYTDFDDTKTHISYKAEILMKPCDMPQKYYPIFKVDVCFESYAIHFAFIGAKDVDDLVAHIKDGAIEIENADCIPFLSSSLKKMKEDYIDLEDDDDDMGRIEKLENGFTDKPYKVLKNIWYYE